jgi:hypothetical protein
MSSCQAAASSGSGEENVSLCARFDGAWTGGFLCQRSESAWAAKKSRKNEHLSSLLFVRGMFVLGKLRWISSFSAKRHSELVEEAFLRIL